MFLDKRGQMCVQIFSSRSADIEGAFFGDPNMSERISCTRRHVNSLVAAHLMTNAFLCITHAAHGELTNKCGFDVTQHSADMLMSHTFVAKSTREQALP